MAVVSLATIESSYVFMLTARYFSYINQIWSFSTDIHKRLQHKILRKSVQQVSCRYVRTDGRKDMTKPMSCDQANAPRKEQSNILELISSIIGSRGTSFKQSVKQTSLHIELCFIAWKPRQYGLGVAGVQGECGGWGRDPHKRPILAGLSLCELICNYELKQSIKFAEPLHRGHKSVQSECVKICGICIQYRSCVELGNSMFLGKGSCLSSLQLLRLNIFD